MVDCLRLARYKYGRIECFGRIWAAITPPLSWKAIMANAHLSLRPAWLKSSELVAANEAFEQSGSLTRDLDAETLKKLVTELQREELSFISNREFQSPQRGNTIFLQELNLSPPRPEKLRGDRMADLPRHLGRLCEAALLKPEQETMLFERMNFLRQQANMHRSLLDARRPSKQRIELYRRLLFLADWHRDRIVEANLRLVFSIVKKFVNQHNPFEDLLSDGIVALMRAADKFDFDRGFRFSTYATQVVRRDAYRSVVTTQEDRQKVCSGLQDMEIDVSDEIRQPNMSEGRWHLLRARLSTMLGDLDRREKLIIRARFALGGHRRVHTLQSLADRLGVSKERVRQLEKRALDKLTTMAQKAGYQEWSPVDQPS